MPQKKPTKNPIKLILSHHLSPGDIVAMTGCIEALHSQFPNKYLTDVDVSFKEIFDNNPHITKLNRSESKCITLDYGPEVSSSDKCPVHFLDGFCKSLGRELNINLPCNVNRPYIYLSNEEKEWMTAPEQHANYRGRYWIMAASSYKTDYSVKKTRQDYLQKVVDHFRGRIQFVKVGGGANDHVHMPLQGVIDFTSKFDLRGFIRLCYHAEGALTLESLCGHIMAAFQKPCVVLASGLYPQQWFAYPTTKVLSYASSMPCCSIKGACWRYRVTPLKDDSHHNNTLCHLPVLGDEDVTARCMYMIKPEEIIRAIESFYDSGLCRF